ncbi:RNAPII transcription regulator C-terminal-domain-containing protein [Terfezia claveryi]|nr:RNAPII transcription regulator C-terminal-domain-containing protein [Terfezia claveryi]
MADVNLYLHNVDKNLEEASRIATDAAKRIESKQLKLLDVIQSMGEYMTDDDATVRAKSIGFLSAILAALDSKALVRQQVSVITHFLIDRLEDETGLKEVAKGLIALLEMQRFGPEDAEEVTLALMKVDLHKHPQGTRFVVLKVMDVLFSKHRDVLKKLSDPFIDGFIELIGGEKDPRNLMIVFSLLKVLIIEFGIERHTEALFEACYVYYPITFTPPPNDPYGITAQDLKVRLRDCIAASGRFSEHVFKPLIDKLDSTSQSVKRDVLQTMAACALSYGPSIMAKHFASLWDAIKFEVLNSSDDELATDALSTMQAIAASLSYGLIDVPQPAAAQSRYLKAIVKETLELLKEPQQKQAKPAGQIVASVAKAGVVPFAYIIKSTLPTLLTVYDDSEGLAKQRAMLEVFNQILESTAAVYGEWGEMEPYPALENPLLEFKEKLFDIYSRALMGVNKEEVGFRTVALKGLEILSKVRKLFADNEIGMVVQYLDEVVLEREDSRQELKEVALQHLLQISTMKPSLIMEITFPALMATLPDSEEEARGKPYLVTLEALAKLSIERAVFEVLLTRLFNKLDIVIHNGSGPIYPRAILSTLLYVLQKKSAADHPDIPTFYERLVPALITKTISALTIHVETGTKANSSALIDDCMIEITGRLVNLVVRSLDATRQEKVLQDVFDLFVFNKPCCIILKNREQIAETFRPFGPHRVEQHVPYMTIFTCIVAGIRKEVNLPVEEISTFITQIAVSIPTLSLPYKTSHLRLLAIIINKWLPPSPSPDLASNEPISTLVRPSISSACSPEDTIRIAFWVTKAITMKGDKLGEPLTLQLVDLLSDPNYGSMASRGFAVLLGEDELLNKQNYAVQRLLSKQKIFFLVVPKLVEAFKRSEQTIKPNYLVALSNILRHIPSKIFLPSLPQLVPLLLQSLDLPTPVNDQSAVDVKLATLSTLSITILESANALQAHVSSLITRLLATATYHRDLGNPGAPRRVRKEALSCLRIFPGTLRNELVLPYKRQVVRGLVACLDDPKRGVRKEAVECRARWAQLDEPGED